VAIEVPDWYRTVALVGVDATGAPVVVLLDSTGAIISVMKGEYAGTLKNVQVDAQGRMIMIPTDPADVWGNAISMGNAELAAVFSFAKRYDRRGMVIFAEGFECGLSSWVTAGYGAGAAIRHTTKQAFSPPYSVQLVAGTDGQRQARLTKYLPFPAVGKMGFEFSFTLDPNTSDVRSSISWYDGTYVRVWRVNYDLVNTTLSCGGADGKLTTLKSDLSLRVSDTQFHTIKLVADLQNEAFVRVLCNSLSYTPTTAAIEKTADTGDANLMLTIRHYSIEAPAVNPDIFVDNIILTQMEPD